MRLSRIAWVTGLWIAVVAGVGVPAQEAYDWRLPIGFPAPSVPAGNPQRADLVAFLQSLTDEELLRDPRFANPWVSSRQR